MIFNSFYYFHPFIYKIDFFFSRFFSHIYTMQYTTTQTTGKTLFVGAGGGGDTAAAIFRAMTNNTNNKCVLGAGYFYDEYKKALINGSDEIGRAHV